jgi:hypothetical protein
VVGVILGNSGGNTGGSYYEGNSNTSSQSVFAGSGLSSF